MNRKLIIGSIIFFIFLLGFILIVLYSEYRNMAELRTEYEGLEESIFSLRKSSLRMWAMRLILSFLIPTLFLITGVSQKIGLTFGQGRNRIVSGILFAATYFVIIFIIDLVFSFYSSYYLAHKYGLSDQSVFRWFEVNIKSFVINDLVFAFVIWIPYLFIQGRPNNWWLYLGLLYIPFAIFINFIYPFLITPIFNTYSSIEDESLKQEINLLLDNAGVADAEIYVLDKSKDTNTINAYMTGIYNAKRIVLWDTIFDLEEDEIVGIAAHEIGHYVKGHIWINIIISCVGTISLLFLVNQSALWVLKNSAGRFGFMNIANYASLPLLILLLNIFTLFTQPVGNYISRTMEKQADLYEISITENRDAAIRAMNKIYDQSLGIPRPSNIYKIWYNSHPTLEERIEFYKNAEFETIDE